MDRHRATRARGQADRATLWRASERQRRSPVGWEYVLHAARSLTDLATGRVALLTATSAPWPALQITGTAQLKAKPDLAHVVVGTSMS
jgi:hypothetical protein